MSHTKGIKEATAVNQTVCENLIDDFSSAVASNNVLEICKIQFLVEQLSLMGRPKLQALVQGDEHFAMQQSKAMKLRAMWKKEIKAGDTIDAYSEVESKWFETKVLSIDHANDTCRVHYNGWHVKYDADLVISENLFCPVHTFSTEKRRGAKAAAAQTESAKESTTSLETATTTESSTTSTVLAEPVVSVENTLGGRASRRRSRAGDAAPQAESQTPQNDGAEPAEEEPAAKKPKVEKDLNDWICGICGLLEATDRTELVLCEGIHCTKDFSDCWQCMLPYFIPFLSLYL